MATLAAVAVAIGIAALVVGGIALGRAKNNNTIVTTTTTTTTTVPDMSLLANVTARVDALEEVDASARVSVLESRIAAVAAAVAAVPAPTTTTVFVNTVPDLTANVSALEQRVVGASAATTIDLTPIYVNLTDHEVRITALERPPPPLPVGFVAAGAATSNTSALLGTQGGADGTTDWVIWWREVASRTFAPAVAHVSGQSWVFPNITVRATTHNVPEPTLGMLYVNAFNGTALCGVEFRGNQSIVLFRVAVGEPDVLDWVVLVTGIMDAMFFRLDAMRTWVYFRRTTSTRTWPALAANTTSPTSAALPAGNPWCSVSVTPLGPLDVAFQIPPIRGLLSRLPEFAFVDERMYFYYSAETNTEFLWDRLYSYFAPSPFVNSVSTGCPGKIEHSISPFSTVSPVWNATISADAAYVAYVVEDDDSANRGTVCISPYAKNPGLATGVAWCDASGAVGFTPKFAPNNTVAWVRAATPLPGRDDEPWLRELVVATPAGNFSSPVVLMRAAQELYVAGWSGNDYIWLFGASWILVHVPSGRVLVPAGVPPPGPVTDQQYAILGTSGCIRIFGVGAPARALCPTTDPMAAAATTATTPSFRPLTWARARMLSLSSLGLTWVFGCTSPTVNVTLSCAAPTPRIAIVSVFAGARTSRSTLTTCTTRRRKRAADPSPTWMARYVRANCEGFGACSLAPTDVTELPGVSLEIGYVCV